MFFDLYGRTQMSQMNGIKGTAEKSDLFQPILTDDLTSLTDELGSELPVSEYDEFGGC